MDADEKSLMEDAKRHEKHVRWQGIAVEQLSYSIHLILTLSIATLGFGCSLLLVDDFRQMAMKSCWHVASLLWLLASIVLGIICTITRLADFRETRKVTRFKYKQIKGRELKEAESCARVFGRWTWCIFRWQLLIFTFGVGWFGISTYFIFGEMYQARTP